MNYDNHEVFTCAPPEASIAAGETQEVTVSFHPDHVRRGVFSHEIAVNVPNQTERQSIHVTGRSWRRQTYVLSFNRLIGYDIIYIIRG